MRDMVKYASEYVSNSFEMDYQVKYRMRKAIEIVQKYPHDKILEVGCGTESTAAYIKGWSTFTVVEPSDDFARIFRENYVSGGGTRLIHSTLEDAVGELKNEVYDYIIVSAVLHEVEDPADFMMKLGSLCGADTVLYLCVPNARSFHRLLANEAGIIKGLKEMSQNNRRLQQHSVFDIESLRSLVEDTAKALGKRAVFIEEGSFFIKPFTHAQMEECIKAGVLDDRLMEGLFRMISYMPALGSELYLNCQFRGA